MPISIGDEVPNLKITVGNDKKSDEEHEEGEASDSSAQIIVGSEHPQTSSSDKNDAVEVKRTLLPVEEEDVRNYTYEGFTTGLDLFEDNTEKLKKRAARFRVPESEQKNVTHVQILELYKSFDISFDENKELSAKSKHVRLNALHVRGVDQMDTQDVLKYFGSYGPQSIEWINDYSCNVVWMDEIGAARALLGLSEEAITREALPTKIDKATKKMEKMNEASTSQIDDEISDRSDEKISGSQDSIVEKISDAQSSEMDVQECGDEVEKNDVQMNVVQESNEVLQSEDNMEKTAAGYFKAKDWTPGLDTSLELDYECDEEEEDDKIISYKHLSENNKNQEEIASSNNSDLDDDDHISYITSNNEGYSDSGSENPDIEVPIPPGIWRIGASYPKAKAILLRFATKDDKKLPGAEKMSQYYKKHGNPNYGGMKGIITETHKQKISALRNKKNFNRLEEKGSEESPSTGPPKKTPIRMRMRADDEELKMKRKREHLSNVRSRLGSFSCSNDDVEKFEDTYDENIRSQPSTSRNGATSRYNIWTDIAKDMAEDSDDSSSKRKKFKKGDLRNKLESYRQEKESYESKRVDYRRDRLDYHRSGSYGNFGYQRQRYAKDSFPYRKRKPRFQFRYQKSKSRESRRFDLRYKLKKAESSSSSSSEDDSPPDKFKGRSPFFRDNPDRSPPDFSHYCTTNV